MVLEVDGESVECLPGQVVRFSGDAKTFARLIDGPVFDLGLITARGSVTGLMVVADVGAVVESDLFVAIGEAVLEGDNKKIWELEPMDALLGMAGHQMVLLSGTAIAIHVNS